MKKYFLISAMLATACGEMPAHDESTAETTERTAALLPGDTFTRTIPAAPALIPRRVWTPGAPLVPAGYNPSSFYYYYSGDLSNPGMVVAIGFDVDGARMLFNYSFSSRALRSFLTEANDQRIIYALQGKDDGGAGNITPKCCIGPGTEYPEQAWSTLWLMDQAHEATFR